MRTVDQIFIVKFQYPVHFKRGVFDPAHGLLCSVIQNSRYRNKTVVVLDDGVRRAFPGIVDEIERYFNHFHLPLNHLIVLQGGEDVKADSKFLNSLYKCFDDHHLGGYDHVVAVGGGALLDLVGYAIATTRKGIHLIRIPTTVSSQNNAVSVKNNMHLFGKKNWLGTFAAPKAVINDPTFLVGLEDRDWLSGLAEAIKIAVIQDLHFFNWLERNADSLLQRNLDMMEYAIFRCVELHLEHIRLSGDPLERDPHYPLEYGYWAADKLKDVCHHAIRHGEALGFGIALNAIYSFQIGILVEKELNRILNLLRFLGFTCYFFECGGRNKDGRWILLEDLEEYHAQMGGDLNITLVPTIGQKYTVRNLDQDLMFQSYQALKGLVQWTFK